MEANFYPLKNFHLFGCPSWKASDLKIIGIKTISWISSRKKASENYRWPFQGKNLLKMGNYTIF